MIEELPVQENPLALVVDDEEIIRVVAGEILEQAGFSVEHARNGVQGLTDFERLQPDLVLMDIMMPEMDGFTACAEIRKRKEGRNVPILVMTQLDDNDSINRAYEVGATDFVVKPINGEALRHRVRYLMRASQAVTSVKEYRNRFRELFDRVPVGLFRISLDGKIIDVNRALLQLGGFVDKKSCLAVDIRDFCVNINDYKMFQDLLRKQGTVRNFEVQMCRSDGAIRWVDIHAQVVSDEEGRILFCDGSLQDITERKEAERATLEKDEQLRQAQKMEAVGRLAGGIAHDFNNFLTAVNGYSDLLISRLKEGDPLCIEVEEIRKAGKRAASLTRQLLAFSRKQVLQPKVLDLNAVIANVGNLLKRLIGEDIELEIRTGEELGSIVADPGQVEQILMNLAINSRDSMPGGGKLTLETSNLEIVEDHMRGQALVQAGRYVVLSVSDTGCGMDDAVKSRLFEPFFTTKEVGKGTGLGLATVYGIVKQSGGYIWCYSEVGRGTCFKIYLPRGEAKAEAVATKPALPGKSLRGTETVLVVEDEEAVRHLVSNILEMRGYRVLQASDGAKALMLCEFHKEPIHLVVTDIVMPGMTGPEMTGKIMERRPDVKVLYMSGYSGGAIAQQGFLGGENHIEKPFGIETLSQKVRDMLDD